MLSSVGEVITLTPGWDEENSTMENADTVLKLETLHEDAIEHVITKLVPQDLCNFSQISKSIEAKTSRPKFWQRINVRKEKIKQEGLPMLFSIDKFKEVQRIDLSYMNFTAEELIENLRAVAASSVVELDLKDVRVDQVPTELLAKIVRQLKKINLSWSFPTTEQCVAVLQACVPPFPQMTHVNLELCQNLREVPVDLLAKALVNLTHINLNDTDLTRQQYLVVVKVCAASPSIVDLSLHGADLEDVPPQTLGQAAGHLSKIDLGWCYLSRDQSISVLDACASSTLNHVDMWYTNLQQVPAELLAKAVANLQSVDLDKTKLTTEQCTAVLEKCKSSSSKLTDINLSRTDLSQVSPQLLEEALRNLQRMRLMFAVVTTEQRIGILNTVLTSSATVHMDIRDGEKASFPDGLFIQAEGTGRLLNRWS